MRSHENKNNYIWITWMQLNLDNMAQPSNSMHAMLRDLEIEKRDPRTVVAIILGGGAGIRLLPLTKSSAKPAVPIGGSYRLIYVPMSNCINSGINKVYIFTQFNSASLNRHLTHAYNLGAGVTFGDGYVETPGKEGKRWFQGTADAVRQFHWLFENHRQSGADITLSCLPMADSRASDFGLMKIDSKGKEGSCYSAKSPKEMI
ncbi:unnamed protein product [Camellia sinensis]